MRPTLTHAQARTTRRAPPRIGVTVTPMAEVRDAEWRWYVGLDAEGTRVGNTLWRGDTVPDELRSRLLAMFALTFEEGAPVLPDVAGKPVYCLLGMTADKHVRLKPQNLVAGLPLAPSIPS